MIARDVLPAPELQEFIYRYRLRHFLFDGSIVPAPKPFPPRPEQCLIFYPRGGETIEHRSIGLQIQRARSVISGQFTERVDRIISTNEFMMISVEFKPGALFRFTGINLSEITNKCIDAEAVFSPLISEVNSRLSSTESYADMISIIELFLKSLAVKSVRPMIAADNALHDLINSERILTVDKLSKNAYLCPRQLERKLSERIGVCPKTFLKLSRFNHSLMMRLAKPQLNWLSIAIESGYNDYQHLVKEYKTYTYNTPTLFLSEEFRSPGRMLGLSH